MRLRSGLWIAFVAVLVLAAGAVRAAESVAKPPAAEMMGGWIEQTISQVEAEAAADAATVPDVPAALDRIWRSLNDRGTFLGTLTGTGWVVLVAAVAIGGQRAVVRALNRRQRDQLCDPATVPSLG